MRKKLVVCGGGSSSHTLIPFLKDSIFDVYVYTSRPEKWAKTIQLEWHTPEGPCIIEGNDNWEISALQVTNHGMRKEYERYMK